MGLIEKWGTGLPRAIEALTEAGLPAPEFKELPISLPMIVHIKNHDVTPRTYSPDDVVTDVARDVSPWDCSGIEPRPTAKNRRHPVD